jgi:hypothetical protein
VTGWTAEEVTKALLKYLRHPIRAASAVYQPRGRFLDEQALGIEALDAWRNRIGTAILVGVAVLYGGLRGLKDHVNGVVNALGVEFVTLAALSLLIGSSLLAYTRPGHRRRAARYLALPFLLSLTPVIPVLAMEWAGGAFERMQRQAFDSIPSLLLFVAEMYVALYASVFVIRCMYLGVTGLCRAADAHPLFAPIMAPLFATTLAIISLIQGAASGPGPAGNAALAVQWGGPITQAGLSYLQVVALRRAAPRLFPFRDGPGGAAQ